ncbi:MBL fold metallo-hydrolase [Desulfococcus multivorans]|uniref:Metal-dependent hydrolase n=1 Tax=Desulfococcus multivorans DSM 2059 TaxID=1121405 RepID=S7UPK6_DESML|nr:MBL fold metallo-hydrolase [Desulfococcus multivorans]AOY59957.1 metal-dependent hydrolase [Desulfococcus multivorans]AQV02107.1 MBL fold metallo-hydrolase [Desulfococcus multivorans]EPR35954.1 metal-dependent hydrolase [Desulfococcus multivorans DSM 2059]SJZ35793.1 Phosphoribosyl 1,2-cyclic phosphodiesterase [Desulfococcus multivorans DSM 2059]
MLIRCWGSRGSIPVSGRDYIKYGGDTTCIEIRGRAGDVIIVDAGTGIRRLGHRLAAEGLFDYHLIFTHAHWDHLMGFPYFKPVYSSRTRLQMYRCPYSKFVETMLSKVMAPPYFPVPYGDTSARISYADDMMCSTAFQIGSVSVQSIPMNHPNSGRGYKFSEDGKSFVFLTDNELRHRHGGGVSYERYLEFVLDADLMMHDAEYTPEEYGRRCGWGHSTYLDALALAMDAGVRRLGLFHLNQDRTDREVDEIVAACRKVVSDCGKSLDCFAVGADMEFTL